MQKITLNLFITAMTLLTTANLSFGQLQSSLSNKNPGIFGDEMRGITVNFSADLLGNDDSSGNEILYSSKSAGFYLITYKTDYRAYRYELLYEHRSGYYLDDKFKMNVISIPVNIAFYSDGANGFRFFAQAGCYVNYNFLGKTNGERMDFGNYRRSNVGISAGCGVDFLTVLTLRLSYKHDLLSLTNDKSKSNRYFNGFCASFDCRFR